MERNYTKKDLERKKKSELKDILKNLGLKASGNKDELIEIILRNQPSALSTNNYFDVLPGDIKGVVNRYRAENEPNNKIVKRLLGSISNIGEMILINRYLEENKIPFIIEKNKQMRDLITKAETTARGKIKNLPNLTDRQRLDIYIDYYLRVGNLSPTDKISITLTKDKIIDDLSLITFIFYFIEITGKSPELINKILRDEGSEILIVNILDDISDPQSDHFYIVKSKILVGEDNI